MMDLVSSVWAGRKGSPVGGLVKEIGLFDEQISQRQTPWTKSFDPTTWYDSKSEPAYFRDLDYDFYNPKEWSYRLDLSSPKGAYLELKHSWYCDDLNLDTP
ncbi:hypothetical protein QBC37DRAFT_414650 [Rhypophila decipiens]|uniref:Uncharacterized protein n=1 Tax=Rhypophila decipiens TaxID=261697 RepID=A0AAN7BB56_9PEZI|nr:hypothetical protein QBC37DRAFT_414650 [Rhypophila decipiens]